MLHRKPDLLIFVIVGGAKCILVRSPGKCEFNFILEARISFSREKRTMSKKKHMLKIFAN